MKKYKTFEEYLQNQFSEDYMGTKDDIQDRFDSWLSNQDIDKIIEYAEEWGKTLNTKEIILEILKNMKPFGKCSSCEDCDCKMKFKDGYRSAKDAIIDKLTII